MDQAVFDNQSTVAGFGEILKNLPKETGGDALLLGDGVQHDDFTERANWLDPPDDPLPTRECVWTPRAKGPGTVSVAVTYEVTAAAGGLLFRFAPRVNTTAVAIDVSELRVVNVKP